MPSKFGLSLDPLDRNLCPWCWLCILEAARVEAGYASCLQNPVGSTYEQNGKMQGESPEPFDNVRLGSLFCAVGAKAFSFLWDAPRPFDNVGPDNV